MLVLSKLTNINHANGGSYDPPLFLYSALFAARGRFGGASPHGGGFGGASPHGGGLWRGFPARLSLPPRYIRLWGGQFFSLFFAYAPGIGQKHPQKFRRLHCRILYCGGKFNKFVKINE